MVWLFLCLEDRSYDMILVSGKGVTFDSGGLCLKKCKGMHEYRADMAGAAVVVGALKAMAQLKIKANVVGKYKILNFTPCRSQ